MKRFAIGLTKAATEPRKGSPESLKRLLNARTHERDPKKLPPAGPLQRECFPTESDPKWKKDMWERRRKTTRKSPGGGGGGGRGGHQGGSKF